jgi:hypothetical protein
MNSSEPLVAAYHWDIKERAICIALLRKANVHMVSVLINPHIFTPSPRLLRRGNKPIKYDVGNSSIVFFRLGKDS